MKFYLVMEQKGYGCDYTIGCGKSVTLLDAQTAEAAVEEANEMFRDHDDNGHYLSDDSDSLKTAYVVASVEGFDFEKHRAEYRAARAKEDAAYRERCERAELERLKQKYGSR